MTEATSPAASVRGQSGVWYFSSIAVVVACVYFLIVPGIQRASQPSVRREIEIRNESSMSVLVTAVDITNRTIEQISLETNETKSLRVAIGESSREVDSRTVQLLVSDARGVLLAEAQAHTCEQLLNQRAVFDGSSLRLISAQTTTKARSGP